MEASVERTRGRIPRKNYAAISERQIFALLSNVDPTIAQPIARAIAHVANKQGIEQQLNFEAIERSLAEVFTGNMRGALTLTTSDYYHVLMGGHLYAFATLTTVGTTNSEIEVYRSTDSGANFTLIETVTVLANVHVGKSRLATRVKHGDLLYYKVKTIGTSAAGLLMQLLIQQYDRGIV